MISKAFSLNILKTPNSLVSVDIVMSASKSFFYPKKDKLHICRNIKFVVCKSFNLDMRKKFAV